MLSGKGKTRYPRKSLSLKKSKVKSTSENQDPVMEHVDIALFFPKKPLRKPSGELSDEKRTDTVQKCEKTSGDIDGVKTHSHPVFGVQPCAKKRRNETTAPKNEETSGSKDGSYFHDFKTRQKSSNGDIHFLFNSNGELPDSSCNGRLPCRANFTQPKNESHSVSQISSKVLRSGDSLLSANKTSKTDSQMPQSPAIVNEEPKTPFSCSSRLPLDDQVIPPTPPIASAFREEIISVCAGKNKITSSSKKIKSSYFPSAINGKTNRRRSLSLKNKMNSFANNTSKFVKVKSTSKTYSNSESLSTSKKDNPSGSEESASDKKLLLDGDGPPKVESDSGKENSLDNVGTKTVMPSPLQDVRKTYKLSRKMKKIKPEAGGELLKLSSTHSGTPGCKNSTFTQSTRIVENRILGCGISLPANGTSSGLLKEDQSIVGDDIVEKSETNLPKRQTSGRSLKRLAEKGSSPCNKRLPSVTSKCTTRPKRSLIDELGLDESFDRDRDSVQDTQTIAMLRNSRTGISPSSIDSSKFDEEKSPSSGQRSNDCDVKLDISMNSLNNEEIAKLIDSVPWSPLPDRSESRKKALVSPAKHYVRRRSTELSYLASTLNVEENSKDKPEGTERQGYKRYLVLEVYRREIMDDIKPRTVGSSEKVLRLFDESSNSEKYCQLRDDWERTEVEHGDIVNIIGEPSGTSSYILDNRKENYIVVHPDILVTPTAISSSIKCLRRSILEKYFKTEGQNEVMFLGTLLHAIFDSALTSKDFSTKSVLDQTKQLLQKLPNLTELYGLSISEDKILSKIAEQADALNEWAQKYFRDKPHPVHGLIDFKDGAVQKTNCGENVAVCVSKVVDIEECVWSPKFGLKGKVDATVEVKINKNPNIIERNKTSFRTSVVPLELKTGKVYSKLGSVEHRAQVILYTLLMMDRYPNIMDTGLLVYLKSGHMLGVPAYVHEKRALMMKRNEMVRHLSYTGTRLLQNMPGMLQDERTCSYCSHAKVCTLYHKSVEKGNSESAGMGKLFDEMTNHLSPAYLEYFMHWNKLISLESKAMKDSGREPDIWCLSGLEREQLGYCLSNMLLVSCQSSTAPGESDNFINKFAKQEPRQTLVSPSDMHLAKGDYIVISQEGGIIALATGFLIDISEEFVTVLLDKNLTQCFHHINSREGQGLYRIDKAEISTGAVIQWSNLAKLFFADSEQDAKLRRVLVDLECPTFARQSDVPSNVSSSQIPGIWTWTSQLSSSSLTSPIKSSQYGDELTNLLNDLNTDQRKAVAKVLKAQDYALILGMPGTGKTTTIACLVRALVTLGKSVLLTSYTHSAVDNILLKLKQSDVDFLRLGSVQKVHPDIQSYSASNAAKHLHTVKELKEFYESKLVVATTCLGVNHAIFNQRFFDYCIVDEASQITQPVCIGSLRYASTFVLVGDHYQLPPLVQSHEAREGGMDVSLFKRLSERHPHAVVNLEHQYRMHKDIMLLSNTLIYEHRLKCGTEETAERLLDLPNWDFLRETISRVEKQQVPCSWLLEVLDPHSPVIFLDTDGLMGHEVRSGHTVYNENEATLAATITRALIMSGLDADSIGIISPYRHQLKVIKQHLNVETGNSGNTLFNVEINTVDKYQGRDKPCVIVSLVRSNDRGHVGDLLRDWRRVNVAITRAKRKLIFLGSTKTLKNNVLFQELLALLEEHSWIYSLPEGACRVKLL